MAMEDLTISKRLFLSSTSYECNPVFIWLVWEWLEGPIKLTPKCIHTAYYQVLDRYLSFMIPFCSLIFLCRSALYSIYIFCSKVFLTFFDISLENKFKLLQITVRNQNHVKKSIWDQIKYLKVVVCAFITIECWHWFQRNLDV